MPLDQETLDELNAQKRANLIANLGQAISGGVTGQNSAGAYFLGQPNRSNDSSEFYGALRAQAAEPALARQREMKSKLDQQALTENSLKLDELKTAMEAAKSNKDSSSDVSISKVKSFQETANALAANYEKPNPKLAAIYRKHAQDIEGKSGATVDALMSGPLYSNAKDVFAENLKAFNASQLEGQKQTGAVALERVKEGAKKFEQKPLNEFQSKSLGFYKRAKDSQEILKDFDKEDIVNKPIMGGVLGSNAIWLDQAKFPERYRDENYKTYMQAKDNFIAASLRQESGAAIGKEEYDKQDRIFFPQPGDSQKVINNKKIARQSVIDNLNAAVGPSGINSSSDIFGAGMHSANAQDAKSPITKKAKEMTPEEQNKLDSFLSGMGF